MLVLIEQTDPKLKLEIAKCHFIDDLEPGERLLLYLSKEKAGFYQKYPDLTHYYTIEDILTGKIFGLYTDQLEQILQVGTLLE
jgi:hypothetical protein